MSALGLLKGFLRTLLLCDAAVYVIEKNGSHHRTVDFRAVNNAALRQTHHVILSFQEAAAVPKGMYKMCLDAWKGYHSLPIAEEDQHIMTFVMFFTSSKQVNICHCVQEMASHPT